MVVDLPAPLGPTNPVTSPGRTANDKLVDGDGPAVGLADVAGPRCDGCMTATLGRRAVPGRHASSGIFAALVGDRASPASGDDSAGHNGGHDIATGTCGPGPAVAAAVARLPSAVLQAGAHGAAESQRAGWSPGESRGVVRSARRTSGRRCCSRWRRPPRSPSSGSGQWSRPSLSAVATLLCLLSAQVPPTVGALLAVAGLYVVVGRSRTVRGWSPSLVAPFARVRSFPVSDLPGGRGVAGGGPAAPGLRGNRRAACGSGSRQRRGRRRRGCAGVEPRARRPRRASADRPRAARRRRTPRLAHRAAG